MQTPKKKRNRKDWPSNSDGDCSSKGTVRPLTSEEAEEVERRISQRVEEALAEKMAKEARLRGLKEATRNGLSEEGRAEFEGLIDQSHDLYGGNGSAFLYAILVELRAIKEKLK